MMLFSLQAIKNKVASCLSLGVFTVGDELHWGDEIHWLTSKNWKGQALLILKQAEQVLIMLIYYSTKKENFK